MPSELRTLMDVISQAIEREETGGLGYQAGAIAPFGANTQMTWTQWKNAVGNGHFTNVRVKETSLTPNSNTLYGCTGLFGLCGPDEIIGLTMKDDPLVEWLGFFPDTECEKFIKAWTYVDVAGTAAGSPGTVYGAACDDPPSSEKGVCEYYIGDYGTLRACGETVKVTDIGKRKCDKQPTYTIPFEGVGPVRIDNDLDLETITGAQTVKHELSRLIITGDKAVEGQFDGLVNLVKTGYVSITGDTCPGIDSLVVDWENDTLSGAVNGHGSIITKIRDVVRRLRWRAQQTSLGDLTEGNIVLVMPHWLAWEVLDEWAIWSFREQVNSQQVVYRDYLDVRNLRDKYSKGLFNGGYITVDDLNVHIIPHDWMPISQDAPNFCADIYVLSRMVGTRRVLQGQYMPSDLGVNAVNKVAGYSYYSIESMQAGRALRWLKYDNACVKPCLLIQPRLYLEAPWAQGVIQNVCVNPQFNPLSVDPQSNYFISAPVSQAESVTQYWYGQGAGQAGNSWFH